MSRRHADPARRRGSAPAAQRTTTRRSTPAGSKRSTRKRSNAKRSTAERDAARRSSSADRHATPLKKRAGSTSRRRSAGSGRAAGTTTAAAGHATPPRGRRRRNAPRTRAERRDAVRRRISAPPPALRAKEQRSGRPRPRLIVTLLVIAAVLLAIVVRVGMLQTAEAESLRSAGAAQWTRSETIEAQRGTIFDRHGNELAMSVPAATISINPKLVENGPATVQLLDDLIGLDDDKVAELLDEVARKERGFVYVARQVDAAIGEQLDAMRRPGVNVEMTTRREMPGGSTGRSVIGRTDIDGAGIAGLEMQYDDVLTGTGGSLTREIAPGGRTIPGSETVTEAPVPGEDLVLTLDRSIQFATEQVLVDQVNEIGARGALAVVMDVDTGELYATASVRRDDETGLAEVTTGNYAAVESYEPGSVAKVITIAAALNEGVVTPDTYFEVPWRKQYYDDLLKDSHEHPTEAISVTQILVESSNIGTITVQEQMGRFVHHDYMRAFGLGEQTALDFPGESPGILKDVDDLWGSERVTVAYGQGVSSTALQMAAAVNTIANDGTYVAPKLVLSTVGPDGELTDLPPAESRQVVSETAAAQTADMMHQVVCRGTATRAQVDGLSIAGKTGTAFKAADNGTYYDDDGNRVYYASFVGFFPAEDPQVTVLISVDEPPAGTNDRFGGTAAAPVFAELVPTLIHELGIQPPEGIGGCEG